MPNCCVMLRTAGAPQPRHGNLIQVFQRRLADFRSQLGNSFLVVRLNGFAQFFEILLAKALILFPAVRRRCWA